MKGAKMKRVCALTLALCIFLVIALSDSFTAAFAGHHCTKVDCPVCQAIQMAQNVVKTIGTGLTAGLPILGAAVLLAIACLLLPSVRENHSSLYTLKVKLNI